MNKNVLQITWLLAILFNTTGCIDRDLCYYKDHPHAGYVKPIFQWKTTEWSSSEIPINGMSYQFTGEGNTYQYDTTGVYKLLTGDYAAIVYNKEVNASFRNGEHIEQIEAYTSVLGGSTIEPGVIFRDLGSFSVLPDDTTRLMLEPRAAVKGLNLTVKVEGLDSPSHIIGINGYLKNCATGVQLYSLKRLGPAATIVFPMKRISGGTTDFSSRITTFGTLEETGNLLFLDLNLYSGGTVSFPFDLSPYFEQAETDHMDVINCTLTVRITRLGVSTGDTEGDVVIDQWEPGTWDTLIN